MAEGTTKRSKRTKEEGLLPFFRELSPLSLLPDCIFRIAPNGGLPRFKGGSGVACAEVRSGRDSTVDPLFNATDPHDARVIDWLPPRAYHDVTVPLRDDGTRLESCVREGDFDRYVAWLADHLHRESIPLTPDQESWLARSGVTRDHAIFQCSEVLGLFMGDLVRVEDSISSGQTWSAYRDWMHDVWADTEDEDRETFDEWLGTSEETYDRIGREMEALEAVGPIANHADIPFRALFAWKMRGVSDPTERRREIERFFWNLEDNLGK